MELLVCRTCGYSALRVIQEIFPVKILYEIRLLFNWSYKKHIEIPIAPRSQAYRAKQQRVNRNGAPIAVYESFISDIRELQGKFNRGRIPFGGEGKLAVNIGIGDLLHQRITSSSPILQHNGRTYQGLICFLINDATGNSTELAERQNGDKEQ